MRGFNINEKNSNKHLFLHGINTFYLLHFRASEVKKRISSDTLPKRLT
jgi:hypothetical protein